MAKILLGICGGIAAYKALDLASSLSKAGHELKCILTANAQRFVPALSFEAITHNQVETGMFDGHDPIAHISLADWADFMVTAPATANILAKAANGLADDLLSSALLAHTKPVLFVPAMNVHMYENPITQENIARLRSRGHYVLEPDKGILACGYEGRGKYPPNEEVLKAICTYLDHTQDLKGKKILITTGSTHESIDPMRFISNLSSGKMGMELARAAWLRGAELCLISGVTQEPVPYYIHNCHYVTTAQEMHAEVMIQYTSCDWIIKCAAVADFQPEQTLMAKLPKGSGLTLKLKATPDILAELGEKKLSHQKLIGFAAQTGDIIAPAIDKMKRKNLDMICANDVSVAGKQQTKVTVIAKMSSMPVLPGDNSLNFVELQGDKLQVANSILDLITKL